MPTIKNESNDFKKPKAKEIRELQNTASFLDTLQKKESIGERLEKSVKNLDLGTFEIPYFTLEESKLLFELTRFARKNPKLLNEFMQREVNPFREIEPIQTLIQYQIQILRDLKTLSLLDIKSRYSSKEIKKKLKEISAVRKEN